MTTTYNVEAFQLAHKRFLTDPKSLSDDDLAQFAIVDAKFAERARAMRAGFVEADDEDTKKLAKHAVNGKELLNFFRDTVQPVLATHAYRSKQLQSRIDSLEMRLLDLEAQRAVANVER